jgi:hypothetical protein
LICLDLSKSKFQTENQVLGSNKVSQILIFSPF